MWPLQLVGYSIGDIKDYFLENPIILGNYYHQFLRSPIGEWITQSQQSIYTSIYGDLGIYIKFQHV